jgi:translation initiation factor IF-2
MEKKKLKLSISGNTNKTISSIEQAKNQPKNTVVIEKKSKRFLGKSNFSKNISTNDRLINLHLYKKNLITLNHYQI